MVDIKRECGWRWGPVTVGVARRARNESRPLTKFHAASAKILRLPATNSINAINRLKMKYNSTEFQPKFTGEKITKIQLKWIHDSSEIHSKSSDHVY